MPHITQTDASRSPLHQEIARLILEQTGARVSVTVTGPGYLNFRIAGASADVARVAEWLRARFVRTVVQSHDVESGTSCAEFAD